MCKCNIRFSFYTYFLIYLRHANCMELKLSMIEHFNLVTDYKISEMKILQYTDYFISDFFCHISYSQDLMKNNINLLYCADI